VEVLDKKRTIVGDGISFWVKIKAKVSANKMEEMAKKVRERTVVEDYKKIQAEFAQSQKEIEKLKKQLMVSSDKQKRNKIEADIVSEEMKFQSKEWYRKGREHWLKKKYDDAIESFTSAISLLSGFAEAYNGRGIVYFDKNQYDRAISDFDKAIGLNSSESLFYVNRGNAYSAEESKIGLSRTMIGQLHWIPSRQLRILVAALSIQKKMNIIRRLRIMTVHYR
jgi:tetratricopeptide (TPR) repeat protein